MICGWYVITRGEYFIAPDGQWKKYGMILRDWSLFWEQPSRKTPEIKVFYRGAELHKKWEFLKKIRPDLYEKYLPSAFHDSSLMAGLTGVVEKKDVEGIKDVLACEAIIDSQKYFRLYSIDYLYMFPAIIRKPISQCVICMSSVYGSGFYWLIVLETKGMFAWASKEFLAKLGFWVIFCLILACANKFIEQKMKL